MTPARITLLVEDLSRLAAALPGDRRYPALERVLATGKRRRVEAPSANHLRFRLFGLEPVGHLPVAALTHVSGTGQRPESGSYWLRADPVTLRADMTRVFMTSSGLAGFDADERAAISGTITSALAAEGIGAGGAGPPWCFPLDEPPGFEFPPLHEALGMDMAEALPAAAGARHWKRIMTDIQVELHQCEANRKRRESGLPEINSVWFWGGGPLPLVDRREFEVVVSYDPVSRGLGELAGSEVYAPDDWRPGDGRLLIDWVMPSADALAEAEALSTVAERLLEIVGRNRFALDLLDGTGDSWRVDATSRFRAWRRRQPLARFFAKGTGR